MEQEPSLIEQLKPQLKSMFTEFPFCIATYIFLIGLITLLACNWRDL